MNKHGFVLLLAGGADRFKQHVDTRRSHADLAQVPKLGMAKNLSSSIRLAGPKSVPMLPSVFEPQTLYDLPDCTLPTCICAFVAPLLIRLLRSSCTKVLKSISFSTSPAMPTPCSSPPSFLPNNVFGAESLQDASRQFVFSLVFFGA